MMFYCCKYPLRHRDRDQLSSSFWNKKPFKVKCHFQKASHEGKCPRWDPVPSEVTWSSAISFSGARMSSLKVYLRGLKLYESLNANTEGFRNEVVWDVLMTHTYFLDYLGISIGCVALQQAKWKNQTTQIIFCSQAMTVLKGAKGLSVLFHNSQGFTSGTCEWMVATTTHPSRTLSKDSHGATHLWQTTVSQVSSNKPQNQPGLQHLLYVLYLW